MIYARIEKMSNDFHTSHIRRVHVDFELMAPDLDPVQVTTTLNVKPTATANRGDERWNLKGKQLQPHDAGWWKLTTADSVNSKDVNEHLRYLLEILLPHCESILSFAKNGKTHFDVLWESTYLYAGTGPIINSEHIAGIASLQADIGFDIYQVDE